TYTELYDRELLDYGIQMATRLDERFGKRTIAAKMTDVPGHTRSLITHMAKAGLKYLHLGVNPSSHVPHVPEMFLWRNTDGSEIVVHYSKDYGTTFEIEGLNDVLYFAHTHDNHGPSTVQQIEEEFVRLREAYPHAEIKASTLDQYAEKVWAI
ncbi:glycoside hydrolase, partial [Bacillus cereus]|nr:glycoside hydrolase [Bacillus cereus]